MAGARKGRPRNATRDAREVPREGAGTVGGAAGQFVPSINVAHKPDLDVTLEDIERLFAWMDRRWGAAPRGEHEAEWWWERLSAVRRDRLRVACQAVEALPARPTRDQFVRAMITGDPNWQPSAIKETE